MTTQLSLRIKNLTCEYARNPLGIDVLRPRLSWQLESDRRGARQTAYQVIVHSGPNSIWDSGKVDADQSVHVEYAGEPLRSGQRATWGVRVWDQAGQATEFSELAWWEMGLLDKGDWVGQWIGSSLVGGPEAASPCPFLRRTFALDKSIVSARLYVTALGLYEFYLNGSRVGDHVFEPGWTDYSKRVQYQVYDVADLLKSGDNAAGAILGDGWYCGHVAWQNRQQYGDRPKLLAQLHVRFADGSESVITTDSTWKTTFGPILESDLLMGESYDARLELAGWDTPGFDDSCWRPATAFDDPGVALVARRSPPVRRVRELQPIADPVDVGPLHSMPTWVFDLGQNMVGWVRLKVKGERGTTIRLRFAEMLSPDGTLYTTNLRSARATDYYTLRGGGGPDGAELFEPRFTFHGFRYVEVWGYPGTPTRDMLTGIVLHSDLTPTGAFECSEPLINQLQRNIQWGQKGNYLEVPTDCPQRDERLGWTGDAQVFIRTGSFNMDVAAFFTKWQQDLADTQTQQGAFPSVAPNPNAIANGDGGPAWADAGVICPWTVYQWYGDARLLEQHYDSMARFIEYLRASSIDLIRCHPRRNDWEGYGDWLSINADTPKDLIGTAFFAYSARLMSQIARVLHRTEDAVRYAQLAEDVRRAFLNRFVTQDGLVLGHTQTAYVLALHFDLLPENLRPAALEALVSDIERRKDHLSTGFVGAPYLPHVLTQAGQLDLAYKLLNQTSWPSWLYSVTQGATTIWERWDGWTHDKGFQDPGMNSFNHYAYGSIGAWLYAVVAGIDLDPARPGFEHILLRPQPGGELTYARASYDSAYGRIASEWQIQAGRFDWHIVVPPNTTATAYVPAAQASAISESGRLVDGVEGVMLVERRETVTVLELASGEYHFVSQLPEA